MFGISDYKNKINREETAAIEYYYSFYFCRYFFPDKHKMRYFGIGRPLLRA